VEAGFDAPDVQRSLALALALNEMYAESRRVLDAAGADANGDRDVVAGYLDLQRGQYLEAEAKFKKVVGARPNSPESVNLLAASVYPQIRFGDTVLLLERAHELDPQLTAVESNLARARAAKAAEILAENSRTVKALPQ
jgi:Flp pilus assembly protein TadD